MKILLVFTPFKKLLAAVFIALVLSLTLTAGSASAVGFGAGAGVFIPAGKMASVYNPGLTLNAHIDSTLVPALLDLRIAANHNRASGSSGGTSYTFNSTGGQALVILAPPFPLIKPYAGLGYGVYRNSTEMKFDGRSKTDNNWGSGVVAQAGVGISLLVVSVGLDAQYLMNMSGGTEFGGYTVGARVSFSL